MTEKINSDATGTVWKIVAPAGTQVKAEDVIVIIESMKMEIPVLATSAGIVTEVMVKEGEPIAEGQLVALIGKNA